LLEDTHANGKMLVPEGNDGILSRYFGIDKFNPQGIQPEASKKGRTVKHERTKNDNILQGSISQGCKYNLFSQWNRRSGFEKTGFGVKKVPPPVPGAVFFAVFGINNLVGDKGNLKFFSATG
jgi:hypothetical protein